MTLELIERLTKVFKDYCGVLTEESMKKNFTLIYELLDEVIVRAAAGACCCLRAVPRLTRDGRTGLWLPTRHVYRTAEGACVQRTYRGRGCTQRHVQGAYHECQNDALERRPQAHLVGWPQGA